MTFQRIIYSWKGSTDLVFNTRSLTREALNQAIKYYATKDNAIQSSGEETSTKSTKSATSATVHNDEFSGLKTGSSGTTKSSAPSTVNNHINDKPVVGTNNHNTKSAPSVTNDKSDSFDDKAAVASADSATAKATKPRDPTLLHDLTRLVEQKIATPESVTFIYYRLAAKERVTSKRRKDAAEQEAFLQSEVKRNRSGRASAKKSGRSGKPGKPFGKRTTV
jgi:hypothetical protein